MYGYFVCVCFMCMCELDITPVTSCNIASLAARACQLLRWCCYQDSAATKMVLLPRWCCYQDGAATKRVRQSTSNTVPMYSVVHCNILSSSIAGYLKYVQCRLAMYCHQVLHSPTTSLSKPHPLNLIFKISVPWPLAQVWLLPLRSSAVLPGGKDIAPAT
jgi:hypothetical protein